MSILLLIHSNVHDIPINSTNENVKVKVFHHN